MSQQKSSYTRLQTTLILLRHRPRTGSIYFNQFASVDINQFADTLPATRELVQRQHKITILARNHSVELYQFARTIINKHFTRLNCKKKSTPSDKRLVRSIKCRQ